jgi:DNA-directed RNA polymerase specialized sigma subunit
MALPDGLYDLLLTEGLTRSLAALDPISADVLALKGGAAEFLADAITRQLATILDDVAGDDADKAKRQLELVNGLLVMLRQRLAGGDDSAGSSHGLATRHWQVLELIYDADRSMTGIGLELDLRESRVCQIHSNAVRQLQCRL